jgi:hypothetical protein
LTEISIHFLLAKQAETQLLPYALAKIWPQCPALEMIHRVTITASGIEQVLQAEDLSRRAAEA